MDIVKNTLAYLKQSGVNGSLSNIVITKNPGPWTLTYVTYDDGTIGCGCANNEGNRPPNHDFIREFLNKDPYDIADKLYDMRDDVFMNSLRISISSALSYRMINDDKNLRDSNYSVEILDRINNRQELFRFVKETDVVTIVGFASWWISALSEKVRELNITDLKNPDVFRVIDFRPERYNTNVFHARDNKEVLKRSDVVYITGETISNNTINEILEYSKNARTRILFGPTSTIYPKTLFDLGVSACSMIILPNTDQFKRQFVLSRGYWYRTSDVKNILVQNGGTSMKS
jgi:uncharacterized protein (DUF4213/DUF364 family)